MKKAIRYITNALLVIGVILAFLAVSTSDYYVIELGQNEPQYVWTLAIVGVVLMIPGFVRMIFSDPKEWEYD